MTSTTVRVYDATGNAKITVQAFAGDVIGYKRNGGGYMRCVVHSIWPGADTRLRLVPEEGGRAFSVPADSRGFLHLFRRGERITA